MGITGRVTANKKEWYKTVHDTNRNCMTANLSTLHAVCNAHWAGVQNKLLHTITLSHWKQNQNAL